MSGFISRAALLVADAAQIKRLFGASEWGIFDSANNAVILGDSVVKFGYRAESRVADFPIEKGSFASYNKVASPYDARVTFVCGGSFSLQGLSLAVTSALGGSFKDALAALTGEAARTAFLGSLERAVNSTDLYDLVTPEWTYRRANIVHYDYERSSQSGVTMLTVDVWLQEIRSAPDPAFSNTKQPWGQSPNNVGNVQPSDYKATLRGQ